VDRTFETLDARSASDSQGKDKMATEQKGQVTEVQGPREPRQCSVERDN